MMTIFMYLGNQKCNLSNSTKIFCIMLLATIELSILGLVLSCILFALLSMFLFIFRLLDLIWFEFILKMETVSTMPLIVTCMRCCLLCSAC